MALALVLRSVSRAKVGALLQQNLAKTSTISLQKDYSQLLGRKSNVQQTKLLACNELTQRNMSSDHSSLWAIEKALSASLLVIVPVTVAMPNFVFDNLFAITSVLHFHWGLEAVVVDYCRPVVIGNLLSKLSMALLYLLSATTLGGLLYYNVNDIGVGKTIQKFWAIGKETEVN